MARVTVDVVKRELVESEWKSGYGASAVIEEVAGGFRFDVTAYDATAGYNRYPFQVDTLACGHKWRGNAWWRLRSPAKKRYCEECSKTKTEAIEEKKYERLLKKAVKGDL